jgi:hypothetical protein
MTNLPVIRWLAATGLLVVTIAAVSACGGGKDEPSPEEANTTLCQERTDLASTVQSVGSLDAASTTVDGLKAVRENVSDAVDEVNDAAIVVAEAEIEDLRAAKDDFLRAVQDVDDVESLRAAAPEIATTAAAVRVAFQAVFAAADCS